jgi:hypothetical protein
MRPRAGPDIVKMANSQRRFREPEAHCTLVAEDILEGRNQHFEVEQSLVHVEHNEGPVAKLSIKGLDCSRTQLFALLAACSTTMRVSSTREVMLSLRNI